MKLTAAGLKLIIAEELGKTKRERSERPVRRLTAEGLKSVIAQEVQRARKSRRLSEMATRSHENLEADLMEMAPGEYLDLKTFDPGVIVVNGQDVEFNSDANPAGHDLTITCVGDGRFTILTSVYGDYDDSLDGDQPPPEQFESDPMSAVEVVDTIGNFSY